MAKNPLISIVLPVWNGERYISKALDSILAQTFSDFELIVVNDCSTDATSQILLKYAQKDERLKVITNLINMKLPTSLNIGFKQAQGEYFTWTSDDNILQPDFLAMMLTPLKKGTADIVYADYIAIDENDSLLEMCKMLSPEQLLFGGGIGAAFLYCKAVHEALQGFDQELFLVEDYDFWVRAWAQGFRYVHIAATPYLYRRHAQALSVTAQDRVVAATTRYRYRKRNTFALNKELALLLRLNILNQGVDSLTLVQKSSLYLEILFISPRKIVNLFLNFIFCKIRWLSIKLGLHKEPL